MAFSLALSRVNSEPALTASDASPEVKAEFTLRKTMLTAVTTLVIFTVFVQVIRGCGWGCGLWLFREVYV